MLRTRIIARSFLAASLLLVLCACASTPPRDQDNICSVLREEPDWYEYARRSERAWGTPIATQLAFVRQESSFRARARPERRWLLGVIPLPRRSSARGFAQAQDPAWEDYRRATGRRFASRSDMKDALDFIGWYNDVSHRRLGLSKSNAYDLYLAYHEGHGGYSRGSYRNKPALREIAGRVDETSLRYQRQLVQCEDELRCSRWYQFWPFCR
jgi:hypothetical protein